MYSGGVGEFGIHWREIVRTKCKSLTTQNISRLDYHERTASYGHFHKVEGASGAIKQTTIPSALWLPQPLLLLGFMNLCSFWPVKTPWTWVQYDHVVIREYLGMSEEPQRFAFQDPESFFNLLVATLVGLGAAFCAYHRSSSRRLTSLLGCPIEPMPAVQGINYLGCWTELERLPSHIFLGLLRRRFWDQSRSARWVKPLPYK